MIVGCQGEDKKKLEIKISIVHEGWKQVGSKRKLKDPHIMAGLFEGGADFWETFTAELAKKYDLKDTLVVISGDGASWIQSTGKEYIPNAIVQLDRFHLRKNLRTAIGQEAANGLIKELDKGNVDVFIDTLEAMRPVIPEKKLKVYNKLLSLCKTYPDHLQDYRKEIGYEYRGIKLYGMDIAETMVDKKLANRESGYVPSRKGAFAMAVLLMLRSNGQLFDWLDKHSQDDILNPIKKLRQLFRKTGQAAPDDWLRVSMPALYTGTRPWVTVLRNLSRLSYSV